MRRGSGYHLPAAGFKDPHEAVPEIAAWGCKVLGNIGVFGGYHDGAFWGRDICRQIQRHQGLAKKAVAA